MRLSIRCKLCGIVEFEIPFFPWLKNKAGRDPIKSRVSSCLKKSWHGLAKYAFELTYDVGSYDRQKPFQLQLSFELQRRRCILSTGNCPPTFPLWPKFPVQKSPSLWRLKSDAFWKVSHFRRAFFQREIRVRNRYIIHFPVRFRGESIPAQFDSVIFPPYKLSKIEHYHSSAWFLKITWAF